MGPKSKKLNRLNSNFRKIKISGSKNQISNQDGRDQKSLDGSQSLMRERDIKIN